MSVNLVDLKVNDVGIVSSLLVDKNNIHRLIDMGITKGTKLRLINCTSNKGPLQLKIRDYYIAVRYNLASSIMVEIE